MTDTQGGGSATSLPTALGVDLLRDVPALAPLSVAALQDLASRLTEETFPAGAAITEAGTAADRLFLIVQGTVEATYRTASGPEQTETLGPGKVFGQAALVSPSNEYLTTVRATTAVQALTLTMPALNDFLRTHPISHDVVAAAGQASPTDKIRGAASLYKMHFRDARREREFLASISFFVTFAIVRTIVHDIRAGRGPFHNVTPGGKHIHHLVWGILSLLGVGYLWLAQLGTGVGDSSRMGMRSTSVLYGTGSALTLDEFALWLNLEDVYWLPQGRESIDAVILFGSILSIGAWGGPFFSAIYRFLRPKRQSRAQV